MIAEEEALVGVVDDDGVVGEALLVEVVEHAADVVIDGLDAAEVVLDVDLVSPFAEGVAGEAGGRVHLEIGFGVVLADAHAGAFGGAGASFVFVVEVVGFGDLDVFEQLAVLGRGGPFAVRRLVMAHEEEWLRFVTALQPVQAEVADEVGTVALVGFFLSVHLNEDGVVVQALTGKDLPIVEAAGGVDEVPFADEGGLVAGGLQILGDVGDGGVELVGERFDAG